MTISGYRLMFKLHGGTHHVLVSKSGISDNIGCPHSVTNSATDHAGGHLDLGLTNRLVVTLRPRHYVRPQNSWQAPVL